MSKIKLSILLLISTIVFQSCSTTIESRYKFSIDYITGGVDGLNLKNNLLLNLTGLDLYDQNSELLIKGNINHSQSLYITNVDNTSDRERISSDLQINIYNQNINCNVYQFNENLEQYYVITSAQNFTSNNKAVEQIKLRNTEIMVQSFILELISQYNFECLNEK